MKEQFEVLLSLTRLGLGHSQTGISKQIDWEYVREIAVEQGLSAIVLDGVEHLPSNNRPEQSMLLCWIGEVLQTYELRYELYRRSVAELAGFYNKHGFKMMLIKGLACSMNWPKPDRRPLGDIDIWLFGKQKEADIILEKEKGVRIDKSEHHHTVFYWRDFMVENHYDFINVHHHKSNVEIEKILKELGQNDRYSVEIYGEKVYLPSANHHALFLIKHMMMHFAAEGITLRQLIDWAFFAKEHHKEVDWNWLLAVLEKYGMKDLLNAFNAICVEDLGFKVDVFNQLQFNPIIKEKVLNDILYPEFTKKLPKGIFRRILYKLNRWRGNTWKHRLCYNESMWSSFWRGVWNHLLKPSSI